MDCSFSVMVFAAGVLESASSADAAGLNAPDESETAKKKMDQAIKLIHPDVIRQKRSVKKEHGKLVDKFVKVQKQHAKHTKDVET